MWTVDSVASVNIRQCGKYGHWTVRTVWTVDTVGSEASGSVAVLVVTGTQDAACTWLCRKHSFWTVIKHRCDTSPDSDITQLLSVFLTQLLS